MAFSLLERGPREGLRDGLVKRAQMGDEKRLVAAALARLKASKRFHRPASFRAGSPKRW
jgi:hypothetical protein